MKSNWSVKNLSCEPCTTLVPQPAGPLWENRPPGHSYCYGLIQLFVNLVLHGPTSIRGASGALHLFAPHFLPVDATTPSPNSGSNWLLRIGLYELERPLEQTDDWIWIVDHTIQIGTVKCLLIVGCRLSQWQQQQRPLTHQDLAVVALEPATSSKSDIVAAEFVKAANRTGTPRAILSDGASDLKRAIEDFRIAHPNTSNLYDVKHKIALFLKAELENDSCWQEFVASSGKARSQLVHDLLVFLTPPTLKHKARFMNLGELVAWAVKIRRFLDAPVSLHGKEINIGKLNLTLGWLRQYDDAIASWNSLLKTAEASLHYLRSKGYHARAADELALLLQPLATAPSGKRLADSVLEFVIAQSAQAADGERLPASSEVIESLIGKGKRLEGQQSRSGFTKMVLGMAAAVVTPTQELIQQAFQHVQTADVAKWAREKLGISVQAERSDAFNPSHRGTNLA